MRIAIKNPESKHLPDWSFKEWLVLFSDELFYFLQKIQLTARER